MLEMMQNWSPLNPEDKKILRDFETRIENISSQNLRESNETFRTLYYGPEPYPGVENIPIDNLIEAIEELLPYLYREKRTEKQDILRNYLDNIDPQEYSDSDEQEFRSKFGESMVEIHEENWIVDRRKSRVQQVLKKLKAHKKKFWT